MRQRAPLIVGVILAAIGTALLVQDVRQALTTEIVTWFLRQQQVEEVQPLPRSLVIPPGQYAVFGQVYDMDREGLYRVAALVGATEHRIVYKDDLNALLSGIMWIHVHGNLHDGHSSERMSAIARQGKLKATCGFVSRWAAELLGTQGYQVRVVQILTLDEWNSYDNGHTMIEVFDRTSDQWRLVDIDNNTVINLSGMDFVTAVTAGNYVLHRYAADSLVDYDLSAALLIAPSVATEEKLRQWYRRVAQVFLVEQGGRMYFFDGDHRARIEAYSPSYQYLDLWAFRERFYPKE